MKLVFVLQVDYVWIRVWVGKHGHDSWVLFLGHNYGEDFFAFETLDILTVFSHGC